MYLSAHSEKKSTLNKQQATLYCGEGEIEAVVVSSFVCLFFASFIPFYLQKKSRTKRKVPEKEKRREGISSLSLSLSLSLSIYTYIFCLYDQSEIESDCP